MQCIYLFWRRSETKINAGIPIKLGECTLFNTKDRFFFRAGRGFITLTQLTNKSTNCKLQLPSASFHSYTLYLEPLRSYAGVQPSLDYILDPLFRGIVNLSKRLRWSLSVKQYSKARQVHSIQGLGVIWPPVSRWFSERVRIYLYGYFLACVDYNPSSACRHLTHLNKLQILRVYQRKIWNCKLFGSKYWFTRHFMNLWICVNLLIEQQLLLCRPPVYFKYTWTARRMDTALSILLTIMQVVQRSFYMISIPELPGLTNGRRQ